MWAGHAGCYRQIANSQQHTVAACSLGWEPLCSRPAGLCLLFPPPFWRSDTWSCTNLRPPLPPKMQPIMFLQSSQWQLCISSDLALRLLGTAGQLVNQACLLEWWLSQAEDGSPQVGRLGGGVQLSTLSPRKMCLIKKKGRMTTHLAARWLELSGPPFPLSLNRETDRSGLRGGLHSGCSI